MKWFLALIKIFLKNLLLINIKIERGVTAMEERVKVFILGTYHFGNCGEHLVDIKGEDITTNKKQEEIKEVIQGLAQFRPNKIAVESKQAGEKQLNQAYSGYCENSFDKYNEIVSYDSEIVQLGFRLGKVLGHTKIYPIDYPVSLPEEVFEYAKKNCPEFYRGYMNEINEYAISTDEFMKSNTVGKILRYLNDPKRIEKEHSDFYLNLARVGAGDTYYGADMLTEWYRRNLRIFGNLQNIAEEKDRILVIYGVGHCRILQELVREYKKFELVDPLQYL